MAQCVYDCPSNRLQSAIDEAGIYAGKPRLVSSLKKTL